jgi:hypothetical protein
MGCGLAWGKGPERYEVIVKSLKGRNGPWQSMCGGTGYGHIDRWKEVERQPLPELAAAMKALAPYLTDEVADELARDLTHA